MNRTGNTILITGGTSGIGQALAAQFHQRGNRVIVAGRRQHRLDELPAAYPGMRGIQLDVEDSGSLQSCVERVKQELSDLNVLINNAGISASEDLAAPKIDMAVPLSIIQTNVVSVLQLTAGLLPTLKRQKGATIIATSSGLAFVPRAHFPTYCASKAFLHSWLQSLRAQLCDSGVEVLELVRPYVHTGLGGAQAPDPQAMPLPHYIDEVLRILDAGDPPRGEILVERVKHLRAAESDGTFDRLFATFNGRQGMRSAAD